MQEWLHGLKSPPNEYRGIPFWSWNDELDPDELRWQVREMARTGHGGYFMHARGGLRTPYMGNAWMDCIKACVEEGRKQGIDSWLYDECGWPSGFAGGLVLQKGPDYHQKWLRCDKVKGKDLVVGSNTVGVYEVENDCAVELVGSDNVDSARAYLHIYYEVDPHYVDLLDEKVISEFIELTHERYFEEVGQAFGKEIRGIFADEPQLCREHVPWSFVLPEEFSKRRGYSLAEALPALYYPVTGFEMVRYDFWKTVSELYTRGFGESVGKWCDEHDCLYTGHLINEDCLLVQVLGNAGVMPVYEYMDVPGIDWLGREPGSPARQFPLKAKPSYPGSPCGHIGSSLPPKQVSSVARQLDKKFSISEMFAGSGWNVSFEELKRIAEWHYALGVNSICQHLSSYSLRGANKRDYPPSLFYQQPWWDEYAHFNDYIARLGMVLSEGKPMTDVLVLHPMRSAWIAFTEEDLEDIRYLDSALIMVSEALLGCQIDFDYGDEEIIRKHGSVEDGLFKVGCSAYKMVIMPPCFTLDRRTVELLREFASQGGKVVSVDRHPHLCEGREDDEIRELASQVKPVALDTQRIQEVVSIAVAPRIIVRDENGKAPANIFFHGRDAGDRKAYFLVSVDRTVTSALTIEIPGRTRLHRLDLESCELVYIRRQMEATRCIAQVTLQPMQSCLLVTSEDETEVCEGPPREVETERIPVGGEWTYELMDPNALTLDYCRYSIDGGEWHGPTPVIQLQQKLVAMGYPVDIELEFQFVIDCEPSELKMLHAVVERPKEFEMEVNGKRLLYEDQGWWRDKSFKKISIAGLCKRGVNSIRMKRRFECSQRVYDLLNSRGVHESQFSVLCCEVELESIYIIGEFAVASVGPWSKGERQTILTNGPFVIRPLPEKLATGDLAAQGLPFFAGSVRLQQDVYLDRLGADKRWALKLGRPSAAVVKVWVNDHHVATRLWPPFEVDVTPHLVGGANRITLELIGTDRNLLGPHHHTIGEPDFVGASSFTATGGWGEAPFFEQNIWEERYCFVGFGLSETEPRAGDRRFTRSVARRDSA